MFIFLIHSAAHSLEFPFRNGTMKHRSNVYSRPPTLSPLSSSSSSSPADSGTLSQVGDGRGGHGDALDGAFVAAPADPEVPLLAPVAAPAVLHDPELLAALGALAVAHQQHGVVGQLEGVAAVPEAAVVVDSLLVVHEVRVDLRGGRRSRERKVLV